jgi:hypothetical protein
MKYKYYLRDTTSPRKLEKFCFALIVCTCRLRQPFADNANSNRKKTAGVGSLDPDLKENIKLPVHLLVNEFNGAVSHF